MKNQKIRIPILIIMYTLILFLGMFIPYVGYIQTRTITYYPLLVIVVISISHLGTPAALAMPTIFGIFAYALGFPNDDPILNAVGSNDFFILQFIPYVIGGVITSLLTYPLEKSKMKSIVGSATFISTSFLIVISLNSIMVDLNYFSIGELIELNLGWLILQAILTVAAGNIMLLKFRTHAGVSS